MRKLTIASIVLIALVAIYLGGPHPGTPVYNPSLPQISDTGVALERYVAAMEQQHLLKKDNEARIVWANDSLKNVTDYALVYLHGFSASQEEGNPVHRNIARTFGCNLYLARLADHGIDTADALYNFTAERLWESGKTALAIGKKLGKKVILMGTSTGGTLALQLAAAYPEVAGLVLYSPNIAINDPNAWLLNNPWGLQIARLVKGSPYNLINKKDSLYGRYWNNAYRLEATVQLEELVETTMLPATFNKIKQPVLSLYYYKDEKQQDPVVKVSAIQAMMRELGTGANEKKEVAIPNAANHVLASPIQSKDIQSVEKETAIFLQEVMKLPVINPRHP